MTKVSVSGLPPAPTLGLKKPSATHQSYQLASTAMGLYPAAMGLERSTRSQRNPGTESEDAPFFWPAGVSFTNSVSTSSFFFSAFTFFGAELAPAACFKAFAASLASFSNCFAFFLAGFSQYHCARLFVTCAYPRF